MNKITNIRKRLKQTRLEKGYSQDYVGEQLHMSQIAYHKIENGKTQLKVRTLLELARILEVEVSYLLGSVNYLNSPYQLTKKQLLGCSDKCVLNFPLNEIVNLSKLDADLFI